MRHLTDTRDVKLAWLEEELFPLCDSLRGGHAGRGGEGPERPLRDRSMYCLFYEPSFLTRTSFERAMSLLGGGVQFTEDASQFFPVRNSSYIEDTIQFLSSLHFDVVVLRSSHMGAVSAAAEADVIPVISGGSDIDHPTQALLDIYTLRRELGTVDGMTIGVVGRVDHRNVNALLMALALYHDVTVTLFPFSGQPNPEVIDYCEAAGLAVSVESSIEPFAQTFDCVYLNGAETAAHSQLVADRNMVSVKIDEELLGSLKSNCIIMDPMQRTMPLMSETTDPRWAGYRQAENGLYIRMALLLNMLGSG